MASCLGLYIEDNLIKYAKVAKDKDNLKIESFGIKFYDRLGDAINQIIAETFSYKVPISINLSEEAYNYFYFFSLLNKNDLKKAVETEFDSFCFDKGYNRNALETRYALVPDLEDKEKIKAIYISTNKAEINNKLQQFEGNTISTLAPLPMTIANIADIKSKETSLIVNIENKTTLTMIVNENIYDVIRIEEGMEPILDNINIKENSYSKAYEICKNSTIYTMEGKELQEEENLYLEDIMPTLYTIVQKVKEYADNSLNKIDRVLITGTGSVINNVDLYFQEYFKDAKCEILKPYFIPDTIKINMKDYIEVNSAIALAMQGLGYGIKNLNFKKPSLADQLPDFLKIEVGSKKENDKNKSGKKGLPKVNFSFSLKGKLDNMERWLLRTCIGIFSLFILYSAFTIFLDTQINEKNLEVDAVKEDTQKQISAVDKDITTINTKTTKYQDMKRNLEDFNNQLTQNNKTKNVIPVLLTELMSAIPKEGVTITSIENTTGTHMVINAQAERYELLGYFKGKIIADGILSPSTVISTSGVKQDNLIKIVIEGDLP
ncbi:MAG: hypothetical protein ACLU84_04980 [Clostridia bacterium]